MLYKILYQIRRVITGEHVQIYVIDKKYNGRIIIRNNLGQSITFKTRKNVWTEIKINLRWNSKIKKTIRKNLDVIKKNIDTIIIS